VSRFGSALPLDESFIQRLEFQSFVYTTSSHDFLTNSRAEYLTMAGRIKKFGYNKVNSLNSKHLSLIFNDLPLSEVYLNDKSVMQLLKILWLHCEHESPS